MKSIEVTSSQFKKAYYNDKTQDLYIVFNNDNVYVYRDVPESVFEGIDKAESKGSYFISEIKKKSYKYEKMGKIPDVVEDITSSKTVNIDDMTGNTVRITGTTTVTSLGEKVKD